ncbi:MAG: hypothetical protein KDC34_11570 [Saprospiraceae bacterium]|nr:hypothetical protein [Saprospiraceae bacterium]
MANTEDWIKEDFLALMLYYAASADMEVSESEVEVIVQKVGKSHYLKAKDTFNLLSDHEVIELIVELKERFYPGSDGKDQLDAHLKDIFQADGEIDQMERMIRMGLDHLF